MPGRIARSIGVLECWSIGLGLVELYVLERKRRELSSLFRSDNADKALMERKIEELDNLERYLDEKISSRDTQR